MPQTFTQLHYHIVFSTKNREPLLTDEIRERVREYLGGIVRGEGGMPILVGGMPDHVHLLVTLPQTGSVADIVRQLKAGSSGWAHEKFPDANLWWQTGYGAFSVSHSAVDAVREYIERQEDHHRQTSFQDEFRAFLRKHGLQPDEEHMWGVTNARRRPSGTRSDLAWVPGVPRAALAHHPWLPAAAPPVRRRPTH